LCELWGEHRANRIEFLRDVAKLCEEAVDAGVPFKWVMEE